MKAYGGVGVYIHIFLTSALAGGEWSASRPGRFTPGERAPCIHWIEGWVDPRVGLDDVEKRKFLTLPGLELDLLVVQPVPSRYTDYAIPVNFNYNRISKNVTNFDFRIFSFNIRTYFCDVRNISQCLPNVFTCLWSKSQFTHSLNTCTFLC
jgi:hypothetical protein